MKIIISLIFILGIIHANGQNSNYILNEERTPICINGKESYEYKDKINNRIDSVSLPFLGRNKSRHIFNFI